MTPTFKIGSVVADTGFRRPGSGMDQMTWRRGTSGDGVAERPRPDVLEGVEIRREQVVRRLLTGGISAQTLRRILPEWSQLIDDVVASIEPGVRCPE